MAKWQLKAGFGKGEISFPQEMFPVEGFIGLHDSPAAGLMLLEAGWIRIAVVSLELAGLSPRGVELCRNLIEQKTATPRERIWVHTIHAVSTPREPGPKGPIDRRPPATERDKRQQELFYDALEAAVSAAAEQAVSSLGEAKLGWGTGTCDVNINRDVETPHGWGRGLNPDGPSNKTMSVLRVEGVNGALKGFWINYGVSPHALGSAGMEAGERLVSSDVCGVCSRMMEEKFGVPTVFCVGAAGDQTTREQAVIEELYAGGGEVRHDLGVTKGLEIVERLGVVMGRDAIAIAESTECTETGGEIWSHALSFPWERKESPKETEETGKGILGGIERGIGVSLFTLGSAAFVAVKPQLNCQTELELKTDSPFTHTFVIGMVNGSMKYMPDRLAYERDTYEARHSMLRPGAAERFVEVVTETLKRRAENIKAGPKREVDWSCKHNILLKNEDGTLSPMDEPYFAAEPLGPGVWKVLSAGDRSYLVEGDREAVCIDSGYGAGNIREYLQTLTDKPVRNIINTHSHFDHTANNGYFEKAYMAEEALTFATVPYKSFEGIDFIQDYERVAVDDGFVYDLGGRTLEVIKIPDHSRDGIALLDRKGRLLFTGDEFLHMGKMLKVSLTTFFGYLEKLMAHRSEYDRLCAGSGIMDASVVDHYYECAKYILDGHPGEKAAPPGRRKGPGGPRGPGPKGMRGTKGPNGEIVYDRFRPHPGDGGDGRPGQAREMYVMEYAGVRIGYDRNKI